MTLSIVGIVFGAVLTLVILVLLDAMNSKTRDRW